MASLLTCDDGAQPAWCPETTDDVLPSVLGLLPQGPAWEADRIPGTVKNKFWRAISEPIAYAYERMCVYIKEFFCNTVAESLDQWIIEYGLDDACGVYSDNLCAKVTLVGGGQCSLFTAIALDAKWAILCEDIACDFAICGCWSVGCVPLGPTPVPLVPIVAVPNAPFTPQEGDIIFDVPEPRTPPQRIPSDSSGSWEPGYGCSYRWRVNVFMPASYLLQGVDAPPDPPIPANVGNLVTGCMPLCGPENAGLILCFLDKIKPAHTVMDVNPLSASNVFDAFGIRVSPEIAAITVPGDTHPHVMDSVGQSKGYLYNLTLQGSINVYDAFGNVIS